MRKRLFILVSTLLWLKGTAQEIPPVKNSLSISTDLVQMLVNEIGIHADQRIDDDSYGITLGFIYPNSTLKGLGLSPSQDLHPTGVYQGMVARFNINQYYGKSKRAFYGLQFVYKHAGYNMQRFFDMYSGESDYGKFVRSEKANSIGVDLYFGKVINDKAFYADFNIGFGVHKRIRNYTTYSSEENMGSIHLNPSGRVPLGNYRSSVTDFVLVLNLRLGYIRHNCCIIPELK